VVAQLPGRRRRGEDADDRGLGSLADSGERQDADGGGLSSRDDCGKQEDLHGGGSAPEQTGTREGR
jgi:hypothetical protein